MSERPPVRSAPALTLNGWLRWDLVRRILPELPGREGSGPRSVLEIGCGQGAVAARLVERYEYVGYEPDADSFARARARLNGRGRLVNSLLPSVPDRAFDVVCAFEVLEHIEDDAAAVRAWSAWLRPGGTLLLSVPANPHKFGPADEAVGHYRRYDRQTLATLLTDSGLTAPDVWSYGFPLGYLLEFARNRVARSRQRGTRAERTAASGRWGQPPDSIGWLTRYATLPFRLVQRPFKRSAAGTGLVAAAQRPLPTLRSP